MDDESKSREQIRRKLNKVFHVIKENLIKPKRKEKNIAKFKEIKTCKQFFHYNNITKCTVKIALIHKYKVTSKFKVCSKAVIKHLKRNSLRKTVY